ncbi:MAG: bile acid:sodium symporter [Bacteroidales bacterium]|jgi:BASS family bile acid:Na+ symporter|nr:bile acid:sodium symporter [Bacteroidales bacterium]
MKISRFIEKYFWVFLITGIFFGLWMPAPFAVPGYLPKILLGMMLFLVFLKIDALEILENIKNYRLMAFIATSYMIIIPVLLFLVFSFFDKELAIGVLLLTAMPAGVSTPALTDILNGNISLAMSIAIVTQLIAPFTVPLLFWVINFKGLEINILLLFKDISFMVFLPLILSQIIKNKFPMTIIKSQHFFTSANVILLFAFVYFAISSQSEIILNNPATLVLKTAILFLVFIILHFIGYLICYKEKKENKIALAVTSAYMNNGLAIVLASTYFGPDMLVLMVLSELPWNTLLAPFKRIVRRLN